MIRKREKIIIAKPEDIPLQKEGQSLSYDSLRKYYNNGFSRGFIELVNPNHPLNGMSGQSDSDKKISHKVRVFKHKSYETGDYVLWMDGKFPRLLRISAVMQDKESRRHINLYCIEKAIGDQAFVEEQVSSFGNQISPFDPTY